MAKAKKAEAKRDSATVIWKNEVRVYTRALHGDKFEELAQEFATKKGGKVA